MMIREYSPEDRAAIEACIHELQVHIATLDPIHRVRSKDSFNVSAYVDATLKEIESHEGKIFVAEKDGEIVGCIFGIIPVDSKFDTLEGYPSKDGRILELIIRSQYRGGGIGKRLMEEMESYFRSKGCKAVHVGVFAPNTEAHRFYVKGGYTDRMHDLIKLL